MLVLCIKYQSLFAEGKYVLPEEKYMLLRSLPHLMWLIDGDYQAKKGQAATESTTKVRP